MLFQKQKEIKAFKVKDPQQHQKEDPFDLLASQLIQSEKTKLFNKYMPLQQSKEKTIRKTEIA